MLRLTILLCSLLATHSVVAKINGQISLYNLPTSYADSANQDTSLTGAYMYLGNAQHALELEYDKLVNVDNKPIQTAQIGVYNLYKPYSTWRLGINNISNKRELYAGSTIIAGVSYNSYYYQTKVFSAGLDLFTTSHKIANNVDLEITQASPYLTTYFYPSFIPGYVHLKTQLNLFDSSSDFDFTNNNLGSISVHLDYLYYAWTLSFKVTSGEEIYAVHDGGYVMFNSDDKYLSSASVFVQYYFNKKLAVKLGTTTAKLITKFDNKSVENTANKHMLMLSMFF